MKKIALSILALALTSCVIHESKRFVTSIGDAVIIDSISDVNVASPSMTMEFIVWCSVGEDGHGTGKCERVILDASEAGVVTGIAQKGVQGALAAHLFRVEETNVNVNSGATSNSNARQGFAPKRGYQ